VISSNVVGTIQAIFYASGTFAALASARAYWRNSAQERAKWLFELYQRFYDSDSHGDIRRRIETGNTRFAHEEQDEQLLQKLDDYLNFFEFISFLLRSRRLKKKEAMAMFDYPLRKMANDKPIRRYLSRPEYGYEGLNELLKDLGYPN